MTTENQPARMGDDVCPDGLLPDGEVCPRCGGHRGPSGVDGGSWVHCPAPKVEKLVVGENGWIDPTTRSDESLVDCALQNYARASHYHSSAQHDAAKACRAEILRRLSARELSAHGGDGGGDRAALKHIATVLGPKVPKCCQGCRWEWQEALQTAIVALATQQPASDAEVEAVAEIKMSRPSSELRHGDYDPRPYVDFKGAMPPVGTKLFTRSSARVGES